LIGLNIVFCFSYSITVRVVQVNRYIVAQFVI